MRFLMFVCKDPSIPFGSDARSTIGSEVEAWVSEMQERGVRLHGDVLAPLESTTTVRVRNGSTMVQDGPQAHSGVPASGFNLLECSDLDEAIEVSARHPIARFGLIELRPIIET